MIIILLLFFLIQWNIKYYMKKIKSIMAKILILDMYILHQN